MIGREISRYRVLSHLGSGGMGEVYLAEDLSLGRKAALKFLPQEHAADEDARRRLLREAQAAASLDHPFVCKVYEVGVSDEQPFIAMEYVTGTTLKDRLAGGPLSLTESLRYGSEIAEAVDFAHASGIVHRDLKPSNVMLTPDGHVKVMDFGVAKRLTAASSDSQATALMTMTATGQVVGTPAYMSPEQLQGQPIDARSDIFAFGLVLYEMLTGVHPYLKPTMLATATAILNEPEPLLAPKLAGAPPLLDHVIGRCLAKDPGRRYPSLRDVQIELTTVAGNSGSAVVPAERRSPRRRWLGVAVAAIVLSCAGLAIWQWPASISFSESALAFKERDWIVMTDFENLTGDPVFDRSLRLALEVAIAQSQYVNVLPPTRVQEALQRMQRQKGERFDEALASEVAIREHVRGVLACSITEIGGVYSLTARLIEPKSRAAVLTESEPAKGKDQVLGALDTLAKRVRRKLGESLDGLSQHGVPLPNATTPSLPALKFFADSFRASGGAGEELLQQAIGVDPDFALAHAELGRSYYFQGSRESRVAGEEHFAKALARLDRLTPRERLWITASAEDSRGNRQRAADAYRSYVEQYPDDAGAWFRLGWTLMAGLGHYEPAVEAFTRATNINPLDAGAHVNLATSYAGLRRDREARDEYEKAFKLQPDLIKGQYVNHEYGFTLVRLGDLEAAADTFRQMIASPNQGQSSRGRRSLALLEMYGGQYARAIEELRLALAIHRANRFGVSEYRDRLYLARALEAKRLTAEAQAELAAARTLIARMSLGTEWLYFIGRIHARAGRVREARQTLALMEKASGNTLTDSSANRNTAFDRSQFAVVEGEIARAEGRFDDAITLFKSAGGKPSWPDPIESLAVALTAKGQLEEAAKQYEDFLARRPLGTEMQEDWLTAHVRLGDVYQRLGRAAEARTIYERLLALWKGGDPDLVARQQATTALARLNAKANPNP